MGTRQALIFAVSFVAAALIIGSLNRYSMTLTVDHRGVLIAYRLDRLTGQTHFCVIPEKGQVAPVCSDVFASF